MNDDYIRFYISPFSPGLQHLILNSEQASLASVPSFHSVQTFPENTYGYIELPAEQGQKLRKKFNGCTLKGMKMRVEEARPEKRKSRQNTEEVGTPAKKSKNRKPEEGVLPGIELPSDRRVKRGWTSDHRKGGKALRKATDPSNLVFRTNLPPNVASKSDSNSKHAKRRKKHQRTEPVTTEVKEFTRTTKYPSFLRDNQLAEDAARAIEHVEGKGWVDEDGNVLEADTRRKQTRLATTERRNESSLLYKDREAPDSQAADVQDDLSSEDTSSEEDSSDASEDSSDASEDSSAANETSDLVSAAEAERTARSSSRTPGITITKPTDPVPDAVHPLESIFKRPAPTSNPKAEPPSHLSLINTSFTFFDQDAEMQDDPGLTMPHTPFTRRDIEGRRIRSAAPTPDTAAIGKRFSFPSKRRSMSVEDYGEDLDLDKLAEDDEEEKEDEEDEQGEETEANAADAVANGRDKRQAASNAEQTEWEKHFWEHRGDYNRSWKARRREKRQETRQATNRRMRS